jgi:hypothetical protein
LIVSVDIARPDAVALWVSPKFVRLSIVSVVPLVR